MKALDPNFAPIRRVPTKKQTQIAHGNKKEESPQNNPKVSLESKQKTDDKLERTMKLNKNALPYRQRFFELHKTRHNCRNLSKTIKRIKITNSKRYISNFFGRSAIKSQEFDNNDIYIDSEKSFVQEFPNNEITNEINIVSDPIEINLLNFVFLLQETERINKTANSIGVDVLLDSVTINSKRSVIISKNSTWFTISNLNTSDLTGMF